MGDLLRGGEVGDERGRDAEAVRDDASDVDGRVPHPFDRGDEVEHTGHGVGVARRAGGEHADGAHLVDDAAEPLLELAHLLGDVLVGKEERRVAEVDHQLGGVLRLREHFFEISGLVVHRGAASASADRAAQSPG